MHHNSRFWHQVNTTIFSSMKLKQVYLFSKLIKIKLLCGKMCFVHFANPLCSINGTNVKSFTQPYSKSRLHSKAKNFFFASERTFRKTGYIHGWKLKKSVVFRSISFSFEPRRNVMFDPNLTRYVRTCQNGQTMVLPRFVTDLIQAISYQTFSMLVTL